MKYQHAAKMKTTIHAIGAAKMATIDAIDMLQNTYDSNMGGRSSSSVSNIADPSSSGGGTSSGGSNSGKVNIGGGLGGSSSSDSPSGISSSSGLNVGGQEMSFNNLGNDDELKFHFIAHKKTPLNEEETDFLLNYTDSSCKGRLFEIAAKLLVKKITVREEALLALSLSGIYNLINPFTKVVFSTYPPCYLDDTTVSSLEPNPPIIIEQITSFVIIDDMLSFIQA
ncbi:uncharacterized protein EV154DRAFT_277001 [Mucor mucedo]|uniref:uncharacterized protein n=1 Tax=Mucor mucedo TaxID=29922 RepID=UPI0022209778|nr:uncharacterized protein EV154DRAFT_277001 [Mucor mucedo]KAI7889514.1 hypothetical protein EV154DRAFT_277001 [Mucor mucedo]